MAFQTVFKRYELKYIINEWQKNLILDKMAPYMKPDKYGRSTIRNLYYDTDSFVLIRRSIEKPTYKEKLRVRSYGKADDDSTVFAELKKKYKHVVYKRRLSLPYADAMLWLSGAKSPCVHTQISDEIDYFLKFYGTLSPKVYISYEREAFYCRFGSDLRITFDENILCRQEELSLKSQVYGTPILPGGNVLMEVKCSGGIPLWLTKVLSEQKIYKTSFSKYGTAYKTIIFPKTHKINSYNMSEVTQNA